MKKRLTREQSDKLIELGINPQKASEIEEYTDAVSQWTHRGWPIFTLADIINLLPSTIYSDARDITYSLYIIKGEFQSTVAYRHYAYFKSFGPAKSYAELIDALYELLIWTIKNKYCKL